MLIAMESDTSSDQRPVIQAREILAKIERGEDVEYDGVIVEGDLDISGLELPTEHVERTKHELRQGLSSELKVVQSKIAIINSDILDRINFSNVRFKKTVSLSRESSSRNSRIVIFAHYANFRGAKFDEDVTFSGAKFNYASFMRTIFAGGANFNSVKFAEDVDFTKTEFSREAIFQHSKFGGKARFGDVQFGGTANFMFAEFTRFAGFGLAQFIGKANFQQTKFGERAYFGGVTFRSDVDFIEAKFTGEAVFLRTTFYGDTYFIEAQFGGKANFLEATFLEDTDFIDAKFEDDITISKLKFNVFYINWKSIKNNLVYYGPAYMALIKNFKVMEQFSDADDCYYQYRKESQSRKRWYSEENRLIELFICLYGWTLVKISRISELFSWVNNYPPFTWIHRFNWSKLLDWVGFVSCGYGVRIQPIILWVLGSVLSFTLLYKLLPQSYGGIAASGPSTVTIEVVNNSTHLLTLSSGDGAVSPSWGECLYFSFTALTGGTPDGLHPVGLVKYAVMVESVLGYLFLALFVVVLARKIIR